ncbi:hypothetical protein, partial [Ruminococcus sp.]|uniref:hypothetical protein n=1 Tax=Ruminococcus sp. TaxID=41978 RepID=UPI003F81DC23
EVSFSYFNNGLSSIKQKRLWVWATPTNALCYRKFLIAERLAIWRLEHNGESLKMRQHKGKSHAATTTNLPLYKGKSATP